MNDILDSDIIGYVDFDEYLVKEGTKAICNNAFYNCRELKRIILPPSCVEIGHEAFRDCYSLQEIVIPESVQIIGTKAFFNCKSLKKIILPNSIKKIGYGAFGECDNLQEINIPSNLCVLENEVFKRCVNLRNITIPSTLTKIEGNPFVGCRCDINSLSPYFKYNEEDHYLYSVEAGSLIAYLSDNKFFRVPNNITIIGEKAFAECRIEKINVPSSVKYIVRNAFELSSIKQIELNGNETIIDDAAFDYTLKVIIVPTGTLSQYRKILPDYKNCIIEDGAYVNHNDVFYSLDGKTLMSYASFNKEFFIPETVTSIADEAFAMCDIEKVVIPSSATNIGHKAFAGCYELEKVFLYSKKLKIWEDAFENCFDYISIIEPNGVETTFTELLKKNSK